MNFYKVIPDKINSIDLILTNLREEAEIDIVLFEKGLYLATKISKTQVRQKINTKRRVVLETVENKNAPLFIQQWIEEHLKLKEKIEEEKQKAKTFVELRNDFFVSFERNLKKIIEEGDKGSGKQ